MTIFFLIRIINKEGNKMIIKKAYAKINLALEVKNKIDGYHKVNNLMVPIDLYDDIILEKSSEDVIVCNEVIEDNICLKAIKLFKEKYNITSNVKLTINKRVPMMAGLAGGSTDCANTLLGLCELFNINKNDEELYDICNKLGSDISFFINTKLALCTNRGEIVNPIDIKYNPIDILIVKPKVGLSTKNVYSIYKWDKTDKYDKITNIIKALKINDLDSIEENIFNDLEKCSLQLSHDLDDLYNKYKALELKPHVSGSGPSIFFINPTPKEEVLIKSLLSSEDFVISTRII
jgi:4-diphosphocytidyl-2-C-methyl-D-erythritol kinase